MNLLITVIHVLTLVKQGDTSLCREDSPIYSSSLTLGRFLWLSGALQSDLHSTKGNLRIASSYRDKIPQIACEPKGIYSKLATQS